MRSLCTAMKSSPSLPQLEKAHAQEQRPNAAKNKKIKLKKQTNKQKNTTHGLREGKRARLSFCPFRWKRQYYICLVHSFNKYVVLLQHELNGEDKDHLLHKSRTTE